MNIGIWKYSVAGLALILLASCGTTSPQQKRLYSWDDYRVTSYDYYKSLTPEASAKLKATLERMISQPGGLRQTVPPGTYAEYGYLLGMEGKHEEAIKMFEREMALYPESAPFMRHMIKRLEP